MLTALLACGITGPAAQRLAPWLLPNRNSELKELIDLVDACSRSVFSSKYLGQLVELTDKERTDYKIFSLRPVDVPWSTVQARRRQRKNLYNRERNKAQRAKANATRAFTHDLDVRAEALYAALDAKWKSLPALATLIGKADAWRMPDGRLLTGNSLRQAMKRAADKLEPEHAESKFVKGRRGQPIRWLRRQRPSAP